MCHYCAVSEPSRAIGCYESVCVCVCVCVSDVPSRPGRPHVTKVSEREVFLLWEEPETDGNSYIHAYKVDWFRPG